MSVSPQKKSLFIIHFQPLELYPPIMNFLQFGEVYPVDFNIYVITNESSVKLNKFKTAANNIHIIRINKLVKHSFILKRLLNYLSFYLACYFYMVKYSPKVILYFETISSFPAIIYKLIRKQKIYLFAHYHEYTTLQEYKTGMILNRINHWLESKYYKLYTWVSHTNEFRLNKFLFDHQLVSGNNIVFTVMPNYPPQKWITQPKKQPLKPYNLVMLGAIGYDTMYLKEIVEWVSSNPSLVKLDLYTNNIDRKAIEYLNKYANSNVTLFSAIDYYKIPDVLHNYDIGLVIYKPFSENIIYGAPNKLFEYNVCGLDVWFPYQMEGSYPYISHEYFPKIVPVNFSKLAEIKVDAMISRKILNYKNTSYVYEDVYKIIYDKIIESFN